MPDSLLEYEQNLGRSYRMGRKGNYSIVLFDSKHQDFEDADFISRTNWLNKIENIEVSTHNELSSLGRLQEEPASLPAPAAPGSKEPAKAPKAASAPAEAKTPTAG